MSVVFSGTNQGVFTSTGNPQIIQLPSGVDWMWVYNETVSYAGGANTGAQFYWRNGMTAGQGTIYTKTSSTNALQVAQIAAASGFYLVNNTINIPGAALVTTEITSGTPPVVDVSSTAGLYAGMIVRIGNVPGALQLGGIDFTIGSVVSNTSFTLAYMSPIASTGSVTGYFSVVQFDPYYYPVNRTITNISQATQAIVTLSVVHGYTVGQKIRFVVPSVAQSGVYYGMTQLNGTQATIVAVGATDSNGYTNTITVNVNTSSFTAFAFPLTSTASAFTPAQVVPIGEDTAEALSLNTNILGDATINEGYMGMMLMPGTLSPAGVNGNVISWVAGKSFNQ